MRISYSRLSHSLTGERANKVEVAWEPSSETQGQPVGSGERARRKSSSTGERAPGYRLSPGYFQKFRRMPASDWAQKMFCIIVPNRRTVAPNVRTHERNWDQASQLCERKGSPSLPRSRFFWMSRNAPLRDIQKTVARETKVHRKLQIPT